MTTKPSQESELTEAPRPEVRERLLAALRGRERWTFHTPQLARLFALSPDDALDALQRIEAPQAWQPGLALPGSEVLNTPALHAARAVIARLPAGSRIPPHRHTQRELTFILDGELMESGSVSTNGALIDKAPGSEHPETVVGASHCLVVFGLRPD